MPAVYLPVIVRPSGGRVPPACHYGWRPGPSLLALRGRHLREPEQPLRIEHGHHLFGVFPDATWRRLIDDSGLERVDVDEHVVFVGRRPAGEKFRRQVEAG
jgi:hypothetical protein